jgi:hypothetical protein
LVSRVCDDCLMALLGRGQLRREGQFYAISENGNNPLNVMSTPLTASAPRDDFDECPVCAIDLPLTPASRDMHIDACLEGQRAHAVVGDRFTVQTLQRDSLQECGICYELLLEGESVAVVNCLCMFHERCLRTWWTEKDRPWCPLHQRHADYQ